MAGRARIADRKCTALSPPRNKEAERFLLGAIVERRKPLSSMTTEDQLAYRPFLAYPAPRAVVRATQSREQKVGACSTLDHSRSSSALLLRYLTLYKIPSP